MWARLLLVFGGFVASPRGLVREFLQEAKTTAERLIDGLRAVQTKDGGLPAEDRSDQPGAWPTGQALATVLWCELVEPSDSFCVGLAQWLCDNQNDDGGWPFRASGDSFVDTTAWAVLGLAACGEKYTDRVKRAVDWLLHAQRNESEGSLGGWGIHPRENDRVYSTFVVLLLLHELTMRGVLTEAHQASVRTSTREALDWLWAGRNEDGGWGRAPGYPTDVANTVHGVLAQHMAGERSVSELKGALDIVRGARHECGAWPSVQEIFELRNGFDLRLSWFTTPYACWVLTVGLVDGATSENEVIDAWRAAARHMVDGRYVAVDLQGRDVRTWASCDFLLGQRAVVASVRAHRERFGNALVALQTRQRQENRAELAETVREQFPYNIASVFNTFWKSAGQSRRRLSLSFTLLEDILRYLAAAAVSSCAQVRCEDPDVDRKLRAHMSQPALGGWLEMLQATLGFAPETQGYPKFLSDLGSALGGPSSPLLARCGDLVHLRNRTTGHGAVDMLSDHEVEAMVETAEGVLFDLLEAIRFLADYESFFIIDSFFDELEGTETYRIKSCQGLDSLFDQKVLRSRQRLVRGFPDGRTLYFYFKDRGSDLAVNLYPFLVLGRCRECGRDTVLTYSGCDGEKVSYLSYQCGHTTSEPASELLIRRLGRWLNGVARTTGT